MASHIYAGAIGEKSTEVNAVVSAPEGAEDVGIASEPDAILINGAALDFSADTLHYSAGEDGGVYVSVEGAEGNVFINNARGADRVYETAPGSGVIRVIVQDGVKAARIYYIYEGEDIDEPVEWESDGKDESPYLTVTRRS